MIVLLKDLHSMPKLLVLFSIYADAECRIQCKSSTISCPIWAQVHWVERIIIRLQMLSHNQLAEEVYFWWVDYFGNPVLYGVIPSGFYIQQLTFGTHPWLITTPNGDLITSIVPNTSNLELTIK